MADPVIGAVWRTMCQLALSLLADARRGILRRDEQIAALKEELKRYTSGKV